MIDFPRYKANYTNADNQPQIVLSTEPGYV
jgi:hypothetical protein